jgi:hypothetical protein
MNEQGPTLARRKISSAWTAFNKFVFPTVWTLMFCSGVFVAGWPDGLIFVATIIVGLSFMYATVGRLLVVEVDDRFLYVSNYRKQAQISLNDVDKITENVLINIHPVTLHLSRPSPFGTRIRFMPKTWQAFFFSSHPIVAELNGLVAQAKAAGRQRA